MTLEIVPLYAALLGLLYFFLTFRAIGARRAADRAIGPLGEERLERRLRAHANFAEYAPFLLLLLAFAEIRGVSATVLHAACLALVVGRCAHAWGVSQPAETYAWRRLGMAGTGVALGTTVLALLAGYA